MSPVQALRNALLSESVEKVVSRPGFMKWAIAGFIGVNMVTRPLFVMLDRETPRKDRAFSAERLAFQEMLSLGCHLGIASSFERLGAWLGGKLYANPPAGESNPFILKLKSGQTFDLAKGSAKFPNGWSDALKQKAHIEQEMKRVVNDPAALARLLPHKVEIPAAVSGSMRAGSIAGTVLALGVVAPWLNNLMLPVFIKGVDAVLGKATHGRIRLSPDEPSEQALPANGNAVNPSPPAVLPITFASQSGVQTGLLMPPRGLPSPYQSAFSGPSPMARL
ncbi:hypothetical protein [Vampirovibrio sp.]|uniref:hypothetical protein n=1 Tax=Vampirovibrio sp. TaxID=2717857 RepID=UPI0035941E8B